MVEPSKETNGKKEITQEKVGRPETAQPRLSAEKIAEAEKQNIAQMDKELVGRQIRLELEKMQLDPGLEGDAKKKASKIEFLGEQEKIEHLLAMAREQGLAFAIKVAKEMHDPYILDVFHDILGKESFYKRFLKQ